MLKLQKKYKKNIVELLCSYIDHIPSFNFIGRAQLNPCGRGVNSIYWRRQFVLFNRCIRYYNGVTQSAAALIAWNLIFETNQERSTVERSTTPGIRKFQLVSFNDGS